MLLGVSVRILAQVRPVVDNVLLGWMLFFDGLRCRSKIETPQAASIRFPLE